MTAITKIFKATIMILLLAFITSHVSAEELVIGQPDSYEYKTLNLEKGQTGDVTVFLETAGAELDGFKVILVRIHDSVILQTGISGADGIVKFPKVEPGHYDVELRKEGDKILDVYVSIGDFDVALTPTPKPVNAKPGAKGKEKTPPKAKEKSLTETELVAEEDAEEKAKKKGAAPAQKHPTKEITIKLGEPTSGK